MQKRAILKNFLKVLFNFNCFVILFMVMLVFSQEVYGKKYYIKWGSTSVRSGLYANTSALAKVVNESYPGEIEVVVLETQGFYDNLERLQKKILHIGPTDASVAYANYQGILDFKGIPNPNLRALWGGYINPIHIVVNAKEKIDSVYDLDGVSFAMNPGTTSGRLIELFFRALNIKPNYKKMSIRESIEAMKTGEVKAWFKAGYKDSAILELESTIDIKILPITKEMVDKFNEVYNGQGLSMIIPPGLFKSVKTSQLSIAYVVTDFVDKDLPEDVVYKIVKAVWTNRKEIVKGLPTLKEGNFTDMCGMAVKYLKVPLHPGAIKFYREIGCKIPDHLIPPEMRQKEN